jgi:hypothetical protein
MDSPISRLSTRNDSYPADADATLSPPSPVGARTLLQAPTTDHDVPLERVATGSWRKMASPLEERTAGTVAGPARENRTTASGPTSESVMPFSVFHEETTVGELLQTLGRHAQAAAGEEAFKLASTDETYRRLLNRYVSGTGETLCLRKDELMGLGMSKLDVRNSAAFGKAFKTTLAHARASGRPVTARIETASPMRAGKPLTLGNFTARYEGELTMAPDGAWKFKGSMRAHDVWDFDPKPFGSETGRTVAGEIKTRIGAMLLPGKPFVVTSEPLAIEQQSQENTARITNAKDEPHALPALH